MQLMEANNDDHRRPGRAKKKLEKKMRKLQEEQTRQVAEEAQETEKEQKKKNKKKRESAEPAEVAPVATDTGDATKKKKKKKKRKAEEDVNASDVEAKKAKVAEEKEASVIGQEEQGEVEVDAALSEKKLKKKKKKELERLRQEEEARQVAEEAQETEDKKKKKKKGKNKSNGDTDDPPSADAEQQSGAFKKSFYTPTERTASLHQTVIDKFHEKHDIKVTNGGGVRPVLEFADANLDERCMQVCAEFERPTPIQSVCWPLVAGGRDAIGIAETGSGKTLAFSVPGLQHLAHRKRTEAKKTSSPMMLVVAPTRELAMQSQDVLAVAGKHFKMKSACVYGGVPKYEQRKALREGVEVIVATPGRLLDLMEEGCCSLEQVSFLVLDEADRMLDQGFERAIRQIIGATHPERQTCLFSATWPETVQKIASEFLSNPCMVTIGSEDLAASKSVTQIVEVVEDRSREWKLQNLLQKYHKNNNRILIFVLYKKEADRITNALESKGWNVAAIHGDRSQDKRIKAIEDFRKGSVPILVATDVAARGLDIPGVEYVINFSFPLTIEDYVHRIGRTGRAGKTGVAHTFFHAGDKLRAGELVQVLKESGQNVPKEMSQFDLNVKRKEHKLYGAFGPKTNDTRPMKKATKITFD